MGLMPDGEIRCDVCEKAIPLGIGRYTDGRIVICVACNGGTLQDLQYKADEIAQRKGLPPLPPTP